MRLYNVFLPVPNDHVRRPLWDREQEVTRQHEL
jgi:hypothetical protein